MLWIDINKELPDSGKRVLFFKIDSAGLAKKGIYLGFYVNNIINKQKRSKI